MSNAHTGRKILKSVLELPELAQAKSAVLNTLSSVDPPRTYGQAMDQFIRWYCSEPRLAFSRIIVLRYRIHLERGHYAPATINLHLAAVRRLAYEATDSGLLSAELAAGIHRVRGVRRLGVRSGNWLTAEQGRAVLDSPSRNNIRGKRDRVILALLLGCGLRRAEAVQLSWENLQLREDRWVIADFVGKGGTHPYSARVRMGQGENRRMEEGSEDSPGTSSSPGQQGRPRVRPWHHPQGDLAFGEDCGETGGDPGSCTA
jgi:integrase